METLPIALRLFLSQMGLKETPIETETIEPIPYVAWKPTFPNQEPPF